MDNSVKQKPNHTQVYEAVTCRYCLYQLDLKKPDCAHCAEEKLRGCDHCCWCFKVLRVLERRFDK